MFVHFFPGVSRGSTCHQAGPAEVWPQEFTTPVSALPTLSHSGAPHQPHGALFLLTTLFRTALPASHTPLGALFTLLPSPLIFAPHFLTSSCLVAQSGWSAAAATTLKKVDLRKRSTTTIQKMHCGDQAEPSSHQQPQRGAMLQPLVCRLPD